MVVAFLDGRRMKGYIHSFCGRGGSLPPFSRAGHRRARRRGSPNEGLESKFLCRDFVGNSEYGESQELNPQNQSRKAEVTVRDGEKLVGSTDTYNPQRVGFFLVPADPRSNNLRVFVIAKNAAQIRWT